MLNGFCFPTSLSPVDGLKDESACVDMLLQ